MESAFFLIYHLYRRSILPFRHIEMYISGGNHMDFIVNVMLCETRPEKTKEEKYRNIMNFLDLKCACRDVTPGGTGPADPKIILGGSVRTVRETIKYTQDELGLLLGIGQPEVSNIENGYRMITSQEILTLFDYIPDINKEAFFGGRRTNPRPTDQKYIYACSLLGSYGFEFLNDQLDLLITHHRYHI